MNATLLLITSFGFSGILLGVIAWLMYQWIKDKAWRANEARMQEEIAKARRDVEERYKKRPDSLDDAIDRL